MALSLARSAPFDHLRACGCDWPTEDTRVWTSVYGGT